MKYFAYGSNMSVKRLQDRVPSAVPIGTFSLLNHKLIFHKHGRDDSAKCDAHHTHDPSDTVLGRLYEIDETEKSTLDHAEGLGNGYDEKIIRVFNIKYSFKAVTYYATNLNDTLKPFTWYKQHVLVGAREANLPKEYINNIESIPAIEDSDKVREAEQLAIHY
ncbi:MAG: gamma-glutamylcyclotransferase [Desulfocapsa sp.]|nr:gamma-glutamylcyclotransferase [Desulfocapsa sp.]